MELIYKEESYAIVGALFEVYNEIGNGFDEGIYHEALVIEFGLRGIPFVSEPKIDVHYKGHLLNKHFKPDFVCYGKIILEIKAVSKLNDSFRQQVFNYLKATDYKLGILANFGAPGGLEYERIAR